MYLRRRGSVWRFRRVFSSDLKTVAESGDCFSEPMNDWSEAVLTVQTDDPDQPDRALLLRMLDDAISLADSKRSTAAMRRQANALNSAVAEYRATQGVGKRLETLDFAHFGRPPIVE